MDERSAPPRQMSDDLAEYLKFVALLVVTLIVILAVAVLSPLLIGRLAPAVLGLDGPAGGQPVEAVREAPAVEDAPAAEPDTLLAPETGLEAEGPAAPEGAAPVEMEVGGLRHEVQPGQTLFQIAELYGVSVQKLAAANNLVNPHQLEAGAILIIPQPE